MPRAESNYPTFADAQQFATFIEEVSVDYMSVTAELEVWHGGNGEVGDRVRFTFRPSDLRYRRAPNEVVSLNVATSGIDAFTLLLQRLIGAARDAGALPPNQTDDVAACGVNNAPTKLLD